MREMSKKELKKELLHFIDAKGDCDAYKIASMAVRYCSSSDSILHCPLHSLGNQRLCNYPYKNKPTKKEQSNWNFNMALLVYTQLFGKESLMEELV